MTQPPDPEARLARLEARVEEVGTKLDANRKAINALGEQTRGRFDHINARFERLEAKVDAGFAVMNAKFAEYDQGFAAMRHGFDQTAAGFSRIAALIEGLEPRGSGG